MIRLRQSERAQAFTERDSERDVVGEVLLGTLAHGNSSRSVFHAAAVIQRRGCGSGVCDRVEHVMTLRIHASAEPGGHDAELED